MGTRFLQTNTLLMTQAKAIDLTPARNTTVLWSGNHNRELAAQFCLTFRSGGYNTLEMLLERDYPVFFNSLRRVIWSQSEEVWYYLSREMARKSSGTVTVFAAGVVNDLPLAHDGDVSAHRSPHPPREGNKAAYCNSVFEKVEGPALDENPDAYPVLLMGRNINARPTEW